MKQDTVAAHMALGLNVDMPTGRTLADGAKGPELIWEACLIPVGCFDRHGDKGYIVDVVTMRDPDTIKRGLIIMAVDSVGNRFAAWCSQNGLPQPDGKNVRKIINGMMADSESEVQAIYVDGIGEVEDGVWALANGVMIDGEFMPMERGHHRQTSSGRRIVFAPAITCEETCGDSPLDEANGPEIKEWALDLVSMFGSMAPIVCAAWVRASVLRPRIQDMDAQLPAMYICGDSHRGKTLMSTITMRMLGSRGERPHASMTSSSNIGVFIAASSRSSLPFVMDEVKPYIGMGDNDLVKSLVNGDIPAKATRSGKLRTAVKIRSMPILVSEFVPGDTSSIANRVFTMNLVTLDAHAKTDSIKNWVWWNDRYHKLYAKWSHSIYSHACSISDDEFANLWKSSSYDSSVICDDNRMNLNRIVTATTIAIMGFKLLDMDSGGMLSDLYGEYCEALSKCLMDMSRLIVEVSAMGRFITALRSGWPSLENRYSSLVSDRIFSYSESRGLIVDHITLHGVLADSRRMDVSRMGNPATVAMVLESEGFKKITDDRILNGRYRISLAKLSGKEWAYNLSRLLTTMNCACAKMIAHAVESGEKS
jgi:hypothetical protein